MMSIIMTETTSTIAVPVHVRRSAFRSKSSM
jgi:hypothetical protein